MIRFPCGALAIAQQAFFIDLGTPRRGSATATAVSADGTIVVVVDDVQAPGVPSQLAWRWTADQDFLSLGDIPGGEIRSFATGMVGLGDLPGARFSSVANGVSGDGSDLT